MRNIGITGGTGFLGSHLAKMLAGKGYHVVIFTRKAKLPDNQPNITYAAWNPDKEECDLNAITTLEAVIHLAGTGISDKRWTQQRKKEILSSRIQSTRFIIHLMKTHARYCKTFIAASSIGIYGPDHPEGKTTFTEDTLPCDDFIGNVCVQWEAESIKAANQFRTTILRLGTVLGAGGGAYPQYGQHIDLGIMPVLGYGNQVISWIEIGDACRLFAYALETPAISGIFNAVAPHPASHKELIKNIALSREGIKRPSPAPAFMLKILLGELSTDILKSCTASSAKIQSAGFTFLHTEIVETIQNINVPVVS